MPQVGEVLFDKEDNLAVDFVAAAANLRATNFGIKTDTWFNIKGMAGNIIHAIATTNAIISGLIVIEAVKVRSDSCTKQQKYQLASAYYSYPCHVTLTDFANCLDQHCT